jgi:cytochrome c1
MPALTGICCFIRWKKSSVGGYPWKGNIVGKPKAPPAPDYKGAAEAQGAANLNATLGTNYLNQVNQVGPDGSLTFKYDYQNGNRLPDGTVIPNTTAVTSLSPEQQKLYDQNNQISTALNDLAQRGLVM